ncbi:MAG: type II toxin-antitoxin system VapC family toxin [Candidatus Helarchaeota archaeon]
MGIFLDTSGIIAVRNEDDNNHKLAKKIMEAILKKEYGACYISDYVFDEAVTLALVRTNNMNLAMDIGYYIFKSNSIIKLFTSMDDFYNAWEFFLKFKDKKLSFTDCSILQLVNRLNIEFIFSFDSHFDGLIKRIC